MDRTAPDTRAPAPEDTWTFGPGGTRGRSWGRTRPRARSRRTATAVAAVSAIVLVAAAAWFVLGRSHGISFPDRIADGTRVTDQQQRQNEANFRSHYHDQGIDAASALYRRAGATWFDVSRWRNVQQPFDSWASRRVKEMKDQLHASSSASKIAANVTGTTDGVSYRCLAIDYKDLGRWGSACWWRSGDEMRGVSTGGLKHPDPKARSALDLIPALQQALAA